VGVCITHTSVAAEVQSETSQVIRTIGFFPLPPRAQPQEPEGQESRYLVEALGGAHRSGVNRVGPELRDLARGGHASLHADYLPVPATWCRALPPEAKVLMVDDVLVSVAMPASGFRPRAADELKI
jgi:hypothetical protein